MEENTLKDGEQYKTLQIVTEKIKKILPETYFIADDYKIIVKSKNFELKIAKYIERKWK